MKTPKVAVIVLNYNGRDWLRRCLGSVEGTDYDDLWTILVDNGSTDGSLDLVRAEFPRVEVIETGRNAGFCEGNNIGIRLALERGADYVVLLNPDTWVEPSWLREMIEAGEAGPGVGIIGAVQLRYDGDGFNSWTERALPWLLAELSDRSTARQSIAVEWVEGSCLAAKRGLLERIGLLDPLYFAFYEEIDLCRRAQTAGFEVVIASRSRVHHHRGGSWEATPERRRERDYRCDRNQMIFNLTDPRRGVAKSLLLWLRTIAVWLRERPTLSRLREVLRMQVELFGMVGLLREKRRRDREVIRESGRWP